MGHIKVFALMLSLCIPIGFAMMGLRVLGMSETSAHVMGFFLGMVAGVFSVYIGDKKGWI